MNCFFFVHQTFTDYVSHVGMSTCQLCLKVMEGSMKGLFVIFGQIKTIAFKIFRHSCSRPIIPYLTFLILQPQKYTTQLNFILIEIATKFAPEKLSILFCQKTVKHKLKHEIPFYR